VNATSQTCDIRETRGAQHVGCCQTSASVVAVHNNSAIEVVINIRLEFVDAPLKFL